MKTQIRVIGIGRKGCGLLDGMMARSLCEELDTNAFPAMAEIRYVAVQTDINRCRRGIPCREQLRQGQRTDHPTPVHHASAAA